MDRHEDAQASYKRALSLQPDRTSTLANLGLSYALSGDLAAAEESLREAAAQPNADMRVTENLALVLGLQGKIDEFEKISGKTAPKNIVEDNADMLREMISPGRSWEALTQTASNETLPVEPSQAVPAQHAVTAQPVVEADVPTASTTTPVEEDEMSLLGERTTSETGLRLRRQ